MGLGRRRIDQSSTTRGPRQGLAERKPPVYPPPPRLVRPVSPGVASDIVAMRRNMRGLFEAKIRPGRYTRHRPQGIRESVALARYACKRRATRTLAAERERAAPYRKEPEESTCIRGVRSRSECERSKVTRPLTPKIVRTTPRIPPAQDAGPIAPTLVDPIDGRVRVWYDRACALDWHVCCVIDFSSLLW
jgi:hypothetical protein